jgi:hypothetical protein
MKKAIPIFLVLLMIVAMFNGCDNDVQNLPDDTSGIGESIEMPTEETEVTDRTEAPTEKEDENSQDSYILSLKPTHAKTAKYPFKDWDEWGVEFDFYDLSHLENGSYTIYPTLGAANKIFGKPGDTSAISCTLDEIKSMQVSWISPYSSYRPIWIKNNSDSVISYRIDVDLDTNGDMTVEQAIDGGYWHWQQYSDYGLDYDKFFDDEPSKDYVEAIVDAWGIPSEVGYCESNGDFVMFALVYETDEYIVLLEGMEDLTYEDNNIKINSVTVCGTNSSYWSIDDASFYTYVQ